MTRAPLPHTPRHEFPPDQRRALTLGHIGECGIERVAQHPVSYRRWGGAGLMIGLTLGVFLALGIAIGVSVATSDDADVPFFVPVLAGVGCWVLLVGLPIVLPQGLKAARSRRRLAAAVPASGGYTQALPGFAGETPGQITYGDRWLRLLTTQGPAWGVPFSSVYVVEELPPKGLFGMPGIDVLATDGTWTEIRVTDNQQLLTTLEQSGTPVLRAVKRL
ncbi:hypothetical protein [Streptomyces profundus]|uniref:hypothetical protein n=1 Tax=Streptomyces profundus TaxID=2867410 RepID=UPI001D165804|nr:hypothetical protein [Streptomyces sp. MA3_2.13]UED85110.1 hypothetical protein K4G22_13645 [Streptomyces sp. MA3_2.13]